MAASPDLAPADVVDFGLNASCSPLIILLVSKTDGKTSFLATTSVEISSDALLR